MKKVILSLVVVMVIVSCVFAFVACAKPEVDKVDLTGWGVDPGKAEVIGEVDAITADMSGEDMFITAHNNFSKANYASVLQVGDVKTTVLGGLSVIQSVEGLRLREDGNTFMYNNSYTSGGNLPIDIKVMENYYVDSEGKVKLLAAGEADNITVQDKKLVAKKWGIEDDFATVAKFIESNPNDPTRLNMYIVNKDTITETSAVETKSNENGDKYYSFSITFNANEAFKEYIPVMKYMLKQTGVNGEIKDKGQVLTMNVEIWENGMFKQYDVVEGYGVSIAGIINSDIELKSQVKFNYDKTFKPMTEFYNNNDFIAKTQLAKAE